MTKNIICSTFKDCPHL